MLLALYKYIIIIMIIIRQRDYPVITGRNVRFDFDDRFDFRSVLNKSCRYEMRNEMETERKNFDFDKLKARSLSESYS